VRPHPRVGVGGVAPEDTSGSRDVRQGRGGGDVARVACAGYSPGLVSVQKRGLSTLERAVGGDGAGS
jgi:hypothetical protein